jgi:uncharacterized membrane protein YedE/YeeE
VKNIFKSDSWSPYAVGVGIGLLSIATFLFMDKALGVSTTSVRAAGLIESAVAPEHVAGNEYYTKYFAKASPIEWQFALVAMLPIGAFLAARLSRSRRVEHIPAVWRARFGDSRALRYAGAFVGGAILVFGARLAGGCTSGHGISGGLQLAVSGWTFFAATFAAGIAAAFALYGQKGRSHV